jgi:hypothetical protein
MVLLEGKGMVDGFSRRGFLRGLLASASVAVLPLPEFVAPIVRTVEPLAAPVAHPPFYVVLDEVGYYMPDGLGALANTLRIELYNAVQVETEIEAPTEIGRAFVASMRGILKDGTSPQEFLSIPQDGEWAIAA